MKALDLVVDLPKGHNFIDSGSIKDLVEYTRILCQLYGLPHDDETLKTKVGLPDTWWDKNNFGGLHLAMPFEGRMIHYISYISSGDTNIDLFIRSHEETHVLYATNLVSVIEDGFNERGLKVNCNELHPETIANLGGILGTYKKGIPIFEIRQSLLQNNLSNLKQFHEAFEFFLGRINGFKHYLL